MNVYLPHDWETEILWIPGQWERALYMCVLIYVSYTQFPHMKHTS